MKRQFVTVLDSIHFLMHAPRTACELEKLLESKVSGHRHIVKLKELGLVYVSGYQHLPSGSPRPIYAWQPKPFARDDLPPPVKKQRVARRVQQQGAA